MTYIKTTGDDRYSIIELAEELPSTMDANVLGILHEGWKLETYFKPDGTTVRLEPVAGHQLNHRGLWVVLANTLYNPRRTLTVRTVPGATYTIDELKQSVLRWLGQDDDILTQFLDFEQIKALLDQISTFDQLVTAVRAINGHFETDRELKQLLESMGIPGFFDRGGGQQAAVRD